MTSRSIANTPRAAAPDVARVVALYNAKRYRQALTLARRLGRAGSVEAARFEAHCLYSLGQVKQAAAALRRLARGVGDPVTDNMALGGILQRERLPGAEDCYRRVLKAKPDHAEAREKLRAARQQRLDRASAVRSARSLAKKNPGGAPPTPEGSEPADARAESLRRRAQEAARAGQLKRAERLWAALVGHPKIGPLASERLVELLLRRGAWGAASSAARAGGRAAAKAAEGLRRQAQRLLDGGRAAQARSLLRFLLTLDDPEARLFARARLFDLAAKPAAAAPRRFELAPLAGPRTVWTKPPTRGDLIQLPLRQAEVALQASDEKRARALWRAAAAALREPLSCAERVERYRLLVMLRDYEEAFAEAERALAQGAGRDSKALSDFNRPWPVALPYFRDSQTTFAEDRVRLKALARAGRHGPWPAYLLVQMTQDSALWGPFEAVIKKARPRHSFMLREAVRCLLQANRFQEAADAAAKTAKDLPGSWGWSTLCYGAEALLCLGRTGEALALFDKAIAWAKAMPNAAELADARAWKGEALLWLGRYAAALTLLDAAIDGGAPYAYCWRAGARYKLGRLKPALEDIEAGLRLYDRDLEAYAWKGEILRRMGRLDEAFDALNAEPLRVSSGGKLSLPLSGPPSNPQGWTWHLLNRALVFAARGDEAGLRADVSALGARRGSMVFTALGVDGVGLAKAKTARLVAVLERCLEAARGCRRPDIYSFSVWGRKNVLARRRIGTPL